MNLLDARLDEIIYQVPDTAKVTISSNKINRPDERSGGLVLIYKRPTESSRHSEIDEFLSKLPPSVNRQNDHSVILDISDQKGIYFQHLVTDYSFDHLIAFGINPSEIGLHIEARPYEFASIKETAILFADPIQNLTSELKKKLWSVLKKEFDIRK